MKKRKEGRWEGGWGSGQLEVTDHIRAAFRLSDHLIKPRSISPQLFVGHLFFQGLRGEVRRPPAGLSQSRRCSSLWRCSRRLTPIPGDLGLDWVSRVISSPKKPQKYFPGMPPRSPSREHTVPTLCPVIYLR